MSKKSRAVIKDNLARAIAPPTVPRRRAAELDGLLNEYAPPERSAAVEKVAEPQQAAAPPPNAAPPRYEPPPQLAAPPQSVAQPLRAVGAARGEAPARDEAAAVLPSNVPHLRFAYEVLDQTLARLDPYPRTVLLRLYRLSAGWNSDTCRVSIGKLAEHCKIGATKVRACLRSLEGDGYIRRLSIDLSNKNQNERGITFKVLLPRLAPPRGEAPTRGGGGTPREAPAPREANKINTSKENTHTPEPASAGAGVGSRFTLKQCIAYAQHRQGLDPNIRSAEGVGRKLHETGREDDLIAEWLAADVEPKPDASLCPDCKGSGMYYPEGFGKGGVKKCEHPKLNAPPGE